MMYVFICPDCGLVRMIANSRSLACLRCGSPMANCEIDYEDWVELTLERRQRLVRLYCGADREKLVFLRPIPHYDRRDNHYV